MIYVPDRWVILQISNQTTYIYKVLASWHSYDEPWRLNSGIEHAQESQDHWRFVGYSQSEYQCYKNRWGMLDATQSQFNRWQQHTSLKIAVLDPDTPWSTLCNLKH